MIWLRRMHLINWMYYGPETIEWKRSNLLTGITGSGKSTLIDALQILMLGEINTNLFNRAAAGSKADRPLYTYLRGKYGNDQFKRADKSFSSYLALDFYDEMHGEAFCYGVVFDISEDNAVEKDFFYIPADFQKEWALKPLAKGSAARDRESFKDFLKQQRVGMKPLPPKEYRTHLLQRLGIYDEHFFKVFRTAVAYVPLNRIEDFIVKNICHIDDQIDIRKMRGAIHEYHRMQRDMADFKSRQAELSELHKTAETFEERRETYCIQEYIIERAKVDRLHEEQLAAEADIVRLGRESARQNEEHSRLKKEEEQRRQTLDLVKQELMNDPDIIRRQRLEKELSQIEREIKERKSTLQKWFLRFQQLACSWERRLSETLASPAGTEMEGIAAVQHDFAGYAQLKESAFEQIDTAALSELELRLEQLRNQALSRQTVWKGQRDEARQQAAEYREQLAELEKGVKAYPKDLLALRAYLQERLTAQQQAPAVVFILADLLTITDPRWVNVTEGYLRRQKFYLLTEPALYRPAIRLLREYCYQYKCYGYRLIHSGSILSQQPKVLDNSLATRISTKHPAARKYTDFLLGRVECVEHIEDIDGRRSALTADGMLYQGFTVSRMNEKDWRMRYIGEDSISQQMEEIRLLLRSKEQEITRLEQLIEPLRQWESAKTMNDEFLENLERAVNDARELPALESRADQIGSELLKIDDSYARGLALQKKQLELDIDRLSGQQSAALKRIGELTSGTNQRKQYLTEKKAAWKEASERFSVAYPEGKLVVEQAAPRYESALHQKGSAEKVQSDFEPALSQTKVKLEELSQTFRKKAERYNQHHTDAMIETTLSSSQWRDAYEKVNSVHLEEYTAHVETAKKRAEEIFCNEFINHLKSGFDTVSREISLLNKALEEFRFGEYRYRFKSSPTENPEMRRYYDLIVSAHLDGNSVYNLLEPGMDPEEYGPLVKTLFGLISSSDSEEPTSRQQVEKQIEKYKSIQTYLRFDLTEVSADGKEYSLSRTLGSKSGGERQTPFYIAILASLMKTYHMNQQNANSIRLVVFDEAFDKIDTGRIEECVKMLREIGFQSIIAAPDHKAPYIAPAVERTLVVVKPDEKNSLLYVHHKMLEESL